MKNITREIRTKTLTIATVNTEHGTITAIGEINVPANASKRAISKMIDETFHVDNAITVKEKIVTVKYTMPMETFIEHATKIN